jgi:hypothetical protein
LAAPKVCIKSGSRDLLRIVPFPAGNEYDFKISVLRNDFELRMHPESQESFYLPPEDFDLKEWDLTYHNSTNNQPTKIHLKSCNKPYQYLPLPISNFANPQKTSFFPIPFMKIGFSPTDRYKQYKAKHTHKVVEIKADNVLEIFIVHSGFDWSSFISKWALFDFIYAMAPMEFFVNGRLRSFSKIKMSSIYSDKIYHREMVYINEEIALLLNMFYDSAIDGKKQQPYISVYENGSFLNYLLAAPVNYYSKNGEKTPPMPAYKQQLEMIKPWASREDYAHWASFFEKINMAFANKVLDGFSLQRYVEEKPNEPPY